MKTIKIIDLLNKIANGEIPKKIKYDDEILEFKFRSSTIEELYNNWNGYWLDICNVNLNDEVEIIEEPQGHKIPEKINDILKIDELIPPVDENMHKIWKQTIKNHNKINEIIDYLEGIE